MRYNIITKASTGMHCFYIDPKSIKSLQEEKRVICKIGAISYHCALMKNKSGEFYVYISKDVMKQLAIREGSAVKPKFERDTTSNQFEFPKEFKAVLKSDPEADVVFKKLTPGNQRALLYLVVRMKTTEKRIEKALLIADKLRNGITSARLMASR